MGELTFWPYRPASNGRAQRYLDAELEGHPILCAHDAERAARFDAAMEARDWDLIPKSRLQAWRQRQLEEIVTELDDATRPLREGAASTARSVTRFASYATKWEYLALHVACMSVGGFFGGAVGYFHPFMDDRDTVTGLACGVLAGMGGALMLTYLSYREAQKYRKAR